MQGGRCAYCERRLDGHKKHIEHFRKRADHAAGVFDWHNLFGSCDDTGSCGKHKDERAKNWRWNDLIKPDLDDPDEFLQFFSDGSIRQRQDLTPAQQQRAQETLRVFNLDQHSVLRDLRKDAVSGWLSSLDVVRTEWWTLLEQGGMHGRIRTGIYGRSGPGIIGQNRGFAFCHCDSAYAYLARRVVSISCRNGC